MHKRLNGMKCCANNLLIAQKNLIDQLIFVKHSFRHNWNVIVFIFFSAHLDNLNAFEISLAVFVAGGKERLSTFSKYKKL